MRFAALTALAILAVLNREITGVLIWLAYVAAYPRQVVKWCILGALVAGMILFLRMGIPTHNPFTIQQVWAYNRQAWRLSNAMLYQSLLIPLWLFVFARYQLRVARMAAAVLIPYLVLFILLGSYEETRLLMPVLLLSIPFIQSRSPDGD